MTEPAPDPTAAPVPHAPTSVPLRLDPSLRNLIPPTLDELADRPSLAPRSLIARSRALGLTLAGLVAAGGAAFTWGQIERRLPIVRHVEVPVAASRGTRELRILQISDLHLYPGQEFIIDFLSRVARTEPVDFVLSTGDNFGSTDGLDLVRAAYEPFLGLPGAFVLGSNDYYSPQHRNWAHYLRRDPRISGSRLGSVDFLEDEFGMPPFIGSNGEVREDPDLPWREMVALFTDAGWEDLSNRAATVHVPDGSVRSSANGAGRVGDQIISLVGVDDPHMDRDRIPVPEDSWEDPAAVRLAVAHAPYVRVLDGFARMAPDLMVAGHTHGGQIGLPGFGALVTNCDLPRAYAKGLHTWHASIDTPLNVSAGLGTSPFAPLRIATRPEVSVIRLVPTWM